MGAVCLVDAGNAAKHPVMHKTAPHSKEYSVKMSVVLRSRNPSTKEGIQRLREIGMLKWTYPAPSPPK